MEGPPARPLPSYTSIDLEFELADIFATNLNPHIRDPDMSDFYSTRMEYAKKGVVKNPPPPIYPLPEEALPHHKEPHRALFSSSSTLIPLAIVFFALPLLVLFFFLLSTHSHRETY